MNDFSSPTPFDGLFLPDENVISVAQVLAEFADSLRAVRFSGIPNVSLELTCDFRIDGTKTEKPGVVHSLRLGHQASQVWINLLTCAHHFDEIVTVMSFGEYAEDLPFTPNALRSKIAAWACSPKIVRLFSEFEACARFANSEELRKVKGDLRQREGFNPPEANCVSIPAKDSCVPEVSEVTNGK